MLRLPDTKPSSPNQLFDVNDAHIFNDKTPVKA